MEYKLSRLTTIEQLKIAAFDTANDIIRTPIKQWETENPGETKHSRIQRVLRETYLTIQELK
jgi:hypothetical protein